MSKHYKRTFEQYCELARKIQDFLDKEQSKGRVTGAQIAAFCLEDPKNPGKTYNIFDKATYTRACSAIQKLRKLGLLLCRDEFDEKGSYPFYYVAPNYLEGKQIVTKRDPMAYAKSQMQKENPETALSYLKKLKQYGDFSLTELLQMIDDSPKATILFNTINELPNFKKEMEKSLISYVNIVSGDSIEVEMRNVNLLQVQKLAAAQHSIIETTIDTEESSEEIAEDSNQDF